MKQLSQQVDATSIGRVDLVVRQMVNVSRSQVKGLIDHECVRVNGHLCRSPATTVDEGDWVTIDYDPSRRYHEKRKQWDDRAFDVVYEDDHLIVVDKVAGTLTIPTDNNERNTLIERVTVYLSHSRKRREASLVHRLDREVSGLLVFGKQPQVAEALIEQFRERKPERVYTAIVAGLLAQDSGTFTSHIATAKNLDRYVTKPSKETEMAITHFRVLKRLADTTLVEVQLETGKRNQIRVHFANAGHPVLGDPRYKKKEAKHPRWEHKRIALHAQRLGFIHPATGEPVQFESAIPSAMQKFLRSPPPMNPASRRRV